MKYEDLCIFKFKFIKNNKTCSKGLIEMYYSNIPIILLFLSKIWNNNNILIIWNNNNILIIKYP